MSIESFLVLPEIKSVSPTCVTNWIIVETLIATISGTSCQDLPLVSMAHLCVLTSLLKLICPMASAPRIFGQENRYIKDTHKINNICIFLFQQEILD
jgi:hypothetical protein